MDQTVTDSDGDLNNQSIVWVFTSGNNVGQWFEAGVILNRLESGYNVDLTDPSASAFYQDWRTAPTFFATGSGTTVGYFTQLTISDPASADAFTVQTATLHAGNQAGIISQTTRYSFIYSADAKGGVTLFGRAGDWHGGSSGNVQVGTQTIT
jgi:hypothetical protein